MKKLFVIAAILPSFAYANVNDVIPGLYITYFNRAPDKSGLAYWEQQASTNDVTRVFYDISSAFAQNSVAISNYPSSMGNTQFVTQMYNYALGVTTPDPAGVNYWVGRLTAGQSRSNLMVEFINAVLLYDSANDNTSTPTEKQNAIDAQGMIKNKVTAGRYFAGVWGAGEQSNVPLDISNNPDTNSSQYLASIEVLSGVSKDAATVDAAYLKSQAYRLSLPFIKKLNDTGITTCANNTQNGLACPLAGYQGQDAEHGRDVTQDNDNDGYAGFNFTKVSSTGQALPANATQWNCIQDNVTGLQWEVKTNDNTLHDQDWTYSWYEPNPNKNGGNPGTQNGGSCANTSQCDTFAYVQAVNTAGWCGHNDWRLPTVDELSNIAVLDRTDPAIDTTYFPNTPSELFWSSSPDALDSERAWLVPFYNGHSGWHFKDNNSHVRLVRNTLNY